MEHGRNLAAFLKDAMQGLKKANTGKIKVITEDFFGHYETDTTGFSLEEAQEISDAFHAGDTEKVKELCQKYGYHSFYHARGILSRSKLEKGAGAKINIGALSIGDMAFVFGPYEMFDTNGMQIKAASPFERTFICAYTNAAFGYIPSAIAFQNGGYEIDGCSFRAGLGEELVEEYLKMLRDLKKA